MSFAYHFRLSITIIIITLRSQKLSLFNAHFTHVEHYREQGTRVARSLSAFH